MKRRVMGCLRIRQYVGIWLAGLFLVLAGCDQSADRSGVPDAGRIDGQTFGTFYEVTLPGVTDRATLEELSEGVQATLERVDRQMSTYREDSDLNRLNQAEVGQWVELPDELMGVLAEAQRVSAATDGAFDVTVGGLVNLWSFGPEAQPLDRPSSDILLERLARVGFRHLELSPDTARARRLTDVFIDLGGIAKGYGVDAVSAYLTEAGVEHFLVSIGGDMMARGERGPERPWLIGVEVPRDGAREAQHVVPLINQSLATSGDYRNYFEVDGHRYSHTIDPRTGMPVDHSLASVSVFHPSNTTADALATAFMVMGADGTLSYAEQHDVAVLLIERVDNRFRSRWSDAFEVMVDERWMLPIRNSRFE